MNVHWEISLPLEVNSALMLALGAVLLCAASNDRGRGTGSDRVGVSCVLLPCSLFSGLGIPLGTNGHKISAESMHGEWQAGTFLPECGGDAVHARR